MKTRRDFLLALLPPLEEGENYVNFGNKKVNDQDRVTQRFASSLEQLSEQADQLQVEGYNSFFGLAKFGPKESGRYVTNAISLKSFFIDLDCGPSKPYETLADGLAALREFCKATSLPRPMIVQSGRGAHVYWILQHPMPTAEWTPHAKQLKHLCAEHNFNIDAAVPADAARVLRMLETNHIKDIDNPIPVVILKDADPIPNELMKRLLEPSPEVLLEINKSGARRSYDPVTLAIMGASESSFKTILVKSIQGTGCAQIANIYDNQATLEEPLWRAGLSIAERCNDRDKAIYVISKGHPGFNAADTDKKARETKGPYTCDTFKSLNPAGCEGCQHKITSPIQLGREIVEATEEDNVVTSVEHTTQEAKTYVIPKFPFPFFRGRAGGVFVHTQNRDGEDVDDVVYPYDFYVVKRMQDPDLGETLLLRLHLPKDGVRDFIMPLASVMAKEKFINAVAQQGIAVLGKKQELLMQYVAKWVEDLQMKSIAEKAHKQFGWLDDDSAIIIGDREITATEVKYSPPSGPTLPLVPNFQTKGDFHVWKDIINVYGREGMEYRAFPFFMGFGALLMHFTALDGFVLNLVSRESGTGKTTVLQAINSIYGRPKELLLAPKDTYNARMQRLGTMQSMAVTMDEITNMKPEDMSQQIYDVTSGRGKNRLRQHDNSERLNHTQFQTGMVTSSNRYVTDALLSIKNFPDGELKRIMEINFKADSHEDATWARQHFSRLKDNYGHAIEPFAQMLVGQRAMVQQILADTQVRVERAADIRNSERYWALIVSIISAGGAIAKKLGLHDIPVRPVFDYGIGLIKESRQRTSEFMFDNEEFLGGFLQRHFHEILVINGKKNGSTGLDYAPIREPRGALTARYEPDTKMLYVVTRTFREDCAKVMANFEEVIAPYKKSKALVDIKKKRMTAGTVANTQAPTNAMCFDTTRLEFFNSAVLTDSHASDGDASTD